MPLKTEYEFTLPIGYVDKNGALHDKGVMRLATAADEIFPMKDPRVQQNPSYLSILILSRVIIKLGTVDSINASLIEQLYAKDKAFLDLMYRQINSLDEQTIPAVCPKCGHHYKTPINFGQEQ